MRRGKMPVLRARRGEAGVLQMHHARFIAPRATGGIVRAALRFVLSALASRCVSSEYQHRLFIRRGHLPEHLHKLSFVSCEGVLTWNLGSYGFAAPRVKELIKFQIEGLGHFPQGFERRDCVAAFHARDVAAQ